MPPKHGFPPILGVVAPSGTGKTTLLVQLVASLREAGLRMCVVKHTHHDYEIDQPGKDSDRLRKAGATCTVLAGHHRLTAIWEHDLPQEPALFEVLERFSLEGIDLILVEGFKQTPIPKIELSRGDRTHWWFLQDPYVIAVVADEAPPAPAPPTFDLTDILGIRYFICQYAGFASGRS